MPSRFLFALRGHVALEQVSHISDALAFLFASREVICVHMTARGQRCLRVLFAPRGFEPRSGRGAEETRWRFPVQRARRVKRHSQKCKRRSQKCAKTAV